MKIIGNTVGTPLPKPDLRQTNPKKGDYVKGKQELIDELNQHVPVRGVDYWTDEDIATIRDYVNGAILGGEW